MREAIIEFKTVGDCEISIEKAIKKWNLLCRINQFNEDFTLVEYTPKGKRKFKVAISPIQARELIKKLQLTMIGDQIFCHAYTYLSV